MKYKENITAILECCFAGFKEEIIEAACNRILGLKTKTGHWIEGQTDNPNIHNIICSCCFAGYPSKGHANSQYTREKFKYCPNCMANMVEPQESEV